MQQNSIIVYLKNLQMQSKTADLHQYDLKLNKNKDQTKKIPIEIF